MAEHRTGCVPWALLGIALAGFVFLLLVYDPEESDWSRRDRTVVGAAGGSTEAPATTAPPTRSAPTSEIEQTERLLADLADPCSSRAYFTRLLGTWYVTLGEVHLPIDRTFPTHRNRIRRAIEEVGAGDDVPVAGLLFAIGECP